MTIRQLIERYKTPYSNGGENHCENTFKGEYIFDASYETYTQCTTMYNYCYDGRRGIWINVFYEGDEVKCVQVNAGREGDDACATICLDNEWLKFLAETEGTFVSVSPDFGSILYVNSLDKDITSYIKDEIGCYGTPSEFEGEYECLIDEILGVEYD